MLKKIPYKELGRYLAIGVVAASIEWSFFYFFTESGWGLLTGFYAAFAIATLIHYFLSIRFVFTERKFSIRQEIVFVFLIAGVGLLINTATLLVCVNLFILNKMVAKIIATGTAFSWNYLARRQFVFKQ